MSDDKPDHERARRFALNVRPGECPDASTGNLYNLARCYLVVHPAPIEGDDPIGDGVAANLGYPATGNPLLDTVRLSERKAFLAGIAHCWAQGEAERDALREALSDTIRSARTRARTRRQMLDGAGASALDSFADTLDVTFAALLTPREPTPSRFDGWPPFDKPPDKASREPDTTAGPPTETPGRYTPAQRLALASGSRELVNDAFSSRRKEDEAHEVYALPGYTEVTSNPIDAAEAWAAHARDLDNKLESAVGLLKGHVLWSGRYVDEKMLYDGTVSFLKEIEKGNHEI